MNMMRTHYTALRAGFVILFLAGLTCPLHAQQRGWPRGATSAEDRLLATPLLVDLDGDGRLEVVAPSFDDRLYVYDHDGTTTGGLPGWSVVLGFSDGSMGSAAAGDVDGDGEIEIVVAGDDNLSRNATVKVFERDGTLLASTALANNLNASAKATPCLIDCYRYDGSTRHSALEIVLRDGDGQLHVLRWNGTGFTDLYDGTSTYQTVFDDSLKDRFGSQPTNPSVAAVDLGADQTYLLVGSTDSKIYRWNVTSTAAVNWQVTKLAEFEVTANPVEFFSSIALGDLDLDGDDEIVVGGSDGRVYVWDGDGTGAYLSGWPKPDFGTHAFISSPAIADIDADPAPEVIVGADDGAVYAWNGDGTAVSGWPVWTAGDIFGSPVVAEIDGVPGLEVLAASFDGHLYAWAADGTALAGWPKRLNTPLYSSPAVGDLHNGGRMAVVTGGFDGRVFVFDLSAKTLDADAGWRQFRGGPLRTGSP